LASCISSKSDISIYQELEYEHRDLFSHSFIRETDESFGLLPSIGVDKYRIAFADQGSLATHGVGPCMAICMKGETKRGRTILALCHTSTDYSIPKVIASAKKAMNKKGCESKTIQTYVVGGEFPCDELSGTLNEEIQILNISADERIIGVRFNTARGDVDLDIVFNEKGVFFSQVEGLKNRLFDLYEEDAGINLDPRDLKTD